MRHCGERMNQSGTPRMKIAASTWWFSRRKKFRM